MKKGAYFMLKNMEFSDRLHRGLFVKWCFVMIKKHKIKCLMAFICVWDERRKREER